ncbi:ATP synthase F1 gamma [Hortaea werneckii]|nr:ATP synthase F1 gamma [Hortaea werneckii]
MTESNDTKRRCSEGFAQQDQPRKMTKVQDCPELRREGGAQTNCATARRDHASFGRSRRHVEHGWTFRNHDIVRDFQTDLQAVFMLPFDTQSGEKLVTQVQKRRSGVTLGQGPEKAVGQRVFLEVGEDFLVDLERREGQLLLTGLGDGFFRVGRDDGGLVGLRVDELVVHDLRLSVVLGEKGDLVGNGLRVGEGGDVLADVGEGERDLLRVASAQLSLALLAQNHQVVVGRLLVHQTTDRARETGVDTTAETLVRAADDQQLLLVLALHSLGLRLIVDSVRRLTVGAGLVHGPLGAGELGRGHDLHRLGDLLDVADGLQTALDLTEGGIVGALLDNRELAEAALRIVRTAA